MTGARVRTVLAVGLVGLLVARLVQALRGSPMPPIETARPLVPSPNHPTVDGGLRSVGTPASTPASSVGSTPGSDPTAQVEISTDSGWIAPADGACPTGYPIKGNLRSGIFHEPGMLAYERTVADRCYVDSATAAADGLRPAKR